MTIKEAKEKGYTHLSKIYGINCYTKEIDGDGILVEAKNSISSFFIKIILKIGNFFGMIEKVNVETIKEL